MSGEGGWKAGAGVPDESGKGLSGGDSWEEKKRENFERRIFQKGEFPARIAGENSVAGEAGDWGKKSEWQVAYTDEEILDLRPIVGVHEDSVHGVNSSVEKGDCIFTAAIDLGTTTIVGYLLDGRTGENLAVESRMNPQMQYGGDVIQRANYALEHGTKR